MRISTVNIRAMKRHRKPIVAITAYDHTFAQLADRAGAHIMLVGDSLGMVVQGHDTTLPVTLDEMIYHSRIVARAAQQRNGRSGFAVHVVPGFVGPSGVERGQVDEGGVG